MPDDVMPEEVNKMIARQPDCPSELVRERFLRHELVGPMLADAEVHFAACPHCAAWQAHVMEEERRLAEHYPAGPFIDDVLRKVDVASHKSRKRVVRRFWWPRLAAGLVAVSAGAIIMLRVGTHGPKNHLSTMVDHERSEQIGIKGGPTLRLYRKRGNDVRDVRNAVVAPGDAIRFEVFPAGYRYLAILSLQLGGKVQPYVPFEGSSSYKLLTGKQQLLPEAIGLDGTGDELIVALFSREPLSLTTATETAQRALTAASGRLAQIHTLGLPAVERRVLLKKRQPSVKPQATPENRS